MWVAAGMFAICAVLDLAFLVASRVQVTSSDLSIASSEIDLCLAFCAGPREPARGRRRRRSRSDRRRTRRARDGVDVRWHTRRHRADCGRAAGVDRDDPRAGRSADAGAVGERAVLFGAFWSRHRSSARSRRADDPARRRRTMPCGRAAPARLEACGPPKPSTRSGYVAWFGGNRPRPPRQGGGTHE